MDASSYTNRALCLQNTQRHAERYPARPGTRQCTSQGTTQCPWLSIIGLSEDAEIPAAASALIKEAEVVVGSERLLARIADNGCERICWQPPLSRVVQRIIAARGRRTVVLATGDPMWFGIGATVAREVDIAEMHIAPAPSAFSLACSRLGWGLAECETLSLHGRPLELLHAVLYPGARLLLLGEDRNTPARVAQLLTSGDYGRSRMSVLECMGGAHERRVDGVASDAQLWGATELADFHTIAVECIASVATAVTVSARQGRTPGLPDTAFTHDGQLTRQTVRAATLARLRPTPRQHLWDIGAGCGSVGIEWMRAAAGATVTAVERNATRAALISTNALALGAPQLHIVIADAWRALTGDELPAPDAVFIGGGLGGGDGHGSGDGGGGGTGDKPGNSLLNLCWQRLQPGGRLVANSVTMEGEQQLIAWHAVHGGSLERITVAHSDTLGRWRGFCPARTITQLSAIKSRH